MVIASLIIRIIYLIIVGVLCIFLISQIFRKNKVVDKISIAVVLIMFLLRLFMLK